MVRLRSIFRNQFPPISKFEVRFSLLFRKCNEFRREVFLHRKHYAVVTGTVVAYRDIGPQPLLMMCIEAIFSQQRPHGLMVIDVLYDQIPEPRGLFIGE